MQIEQLPGAIGYAKQNSRRRIWKKIVRVMACIVVFCTTYALILPAITQENEVFCGMENHVHEESCYVKVSDPSLAQLVCTAERLGIHEHDDSCFDEAGNNLCGVADYVIHTHNTACFDVEQNLICPLPEIPVHEHNEACYRTILVDAVTGDPIEAVPEDSVVQGDVSEDFDTQEQPIADEHLHGPDCYVLERGEQICVNEDAGHTHDAACYQPSTELCCTLEENHVHGEACYEVSYICELGDDEGHIHEMSCYGTTDVLLCQEVEGHVHTDDCYVLQQICQDVERDAHEHNDNCYAWNEVQVCTDGDAEDELAERDANIVLTDDAGLEPADLQQTDARKEAGAATRIVEEKRVLCCTEPEAEIHIHDNHCFAILEQNEACTLEESEEHAHTFLCEGNWALVCEKEIHAHTLACYADIHADVESPADWENTFDHIELTGDWTEDLLTIARTQLGYTESTKNYIVLEDGAAVMPYTRYGEWYGEPYAEWNTLFVQFCLEYAGVRNMPLAEDAHRWMKALNREALYFAADEIEPQPGWLMFLDSDLDGRADQVAIVAEIELAVEHSDEMILLAVASEETDSITVIQGDVVNCVKRVTYDLADETIMGYSMLPEGISEEAALVIELIDELPSVDEIEAQVEDAKDVDELEAWLGEISLQIQAAYVAYNDLTEEDQEMVSNVDKLMELEELYAAPVIAENVQYVIDLIEELPSAAEIDEQSAWYQAEEDAEGEEAWLSDVYEQVQQAYWEYSQLTEREQAMVSNADKLMELEYIWSVETYDTTIRNYAPDTIPSADTDSFITMNLYDYLGSTDKYPYGINTEHINTTYSYEDTNGNSVTVHKHPVFPWYGGARYWGDKENYDRTADISVDFGNSIITDYTLTSDGSGAVSNLGGPINSTASADPANQPVGMSQNESASDTTYDVLARILTGSGYPALSQNVGGNQLEYLFGGDQTADYVVKQNRENIDGLFLYNEETGMYSYDSRSNHAQFDAEDSKFVLYDATLTPNFIVYPFGNFLPFNVIDDTSKAMRLGELTSAQDGQEGQLRYYLGGDIIGPLQGKRAGGSITPSEDRMLTALSQYRTSLGADAQNNKESQPWYTWGAKDAILDYLTGTPGPLPEGAEPPLDLETLYNIDYDEAKNFYFGMDMSMNLMMPKDGKVGKNNAEDMVFNFSGDDDVWVYLDGILFLDLSGTHRHVGGQIDFTHGKIHYYALDPSTGDLSSSPYKTFTFEDIVREALTYKYRNDPTVNIDDEVAKLINEDGTFYDYSIHSFKFFYMERGAGSSVCSINFNFPMLRNNTVSVTKEVAPDANMDILGDTDYYFSIMDGDGNKSSLLADTGTKYTIFDSVGKEIGTGTVGEYGIFTLKAGQTAEFSLPENSGKYYVQELIRKEDLPQYGGDPTSKEATGDVQINNVTAGYRKLINWSARTYFPADAENPTIGPGGYEWYGYSSTITDASENSAFSYNAKNMVETDNLGSLAISKTMVADQSLAADEFFEMYVTLSGEALPKGTTYTVDSDSRTVTQAGIVEIAAGETAVIPNILSGTVFTVEEKTGGYTAVYSVLHPSAADNAEYPDGNNINCATGVVRAQNDQGTMVTVSITNYEHGAGLQIPISKSYYVYDGNPHTYTFVLERVADAQGTALSRPEEPITHTVTLEDESNQINFPLILLKQDLPAFTGTTTLYYKLTEDVSEDGNTLENDQVFIVQIEVTEVTAATDTLRIGDITAELEKLWRYDETAEPPAFVEDPDGEADFINTLTGDLKLSKTVISSDPDAQTFTFAVALQQGNAQVPITGGYLIDAFTPDGSGGYTQVYDDFHAQWYIHSTGCTCCTEACTLCETCGVCQSCEGGDGCAGTVAYTVHFTNFMDGEYAVIKNIPIGTTWTITEAPATSVGYAVTYTVTVNGGTPAGGSGNAVQMVSPGITAGETHVAFTNTIMYELPETGGGGCMNYWMGGGLLMSVPLLCSFRRRRCGRKRVIGR